MISIYLQICNVQAMATGGGDILMVAAIDFGTTYSGYAYSLLGEYNKDKLNIHANQAWNSGGKSLMSLKTPTCILMKKNGESFTFESFGYEAENQYADIVIEREADDYYFFDRFKMMLYTCEVSFNFLFVWILVHFYYVLISDFLCFAFNVAGEM